MFLFFNMVRLMAFLPVGNAVKAASGATVRLNGFATLLAFLACVPALVYRKIDVSFVDQEVGAQPQGPHRQLHRGLLLQPRVQPLDGRFRREAGGVPRLHDRPRPPRRPPFPRPRQRQPRRHQRREDVRIHQISL